MAPIGRLSAARISRHSRLGSQDGRQVSPTIRIQLIMGRWREGKREAPTVRGAERPWLGLCAVRVGLAREGEEGKYNPAQVLLGGSSGPEYLSRIPIQIGVSAHAVVG